MWVLECNVSYEQVFKMDFQVMFCMIYQQIHYILYEKSKHIILLPKKCNGGGGGDHIGPHLTTQLGLIKNI